MVRTLLIPSDWTTAINAVIFEVVLITIIFYLTADVCARLNYLALVDGSVHDLVVVSPPLLGGGVISTSRNRSLLMLTLRGLGVFLIFGTALTIDGESEQSLVTRTKQVRSVADVLNSTTEAKVEELVKTRFSCVVSTNDTMVFGRIDTDNYCETDVRLLNDSIRIHVPTSPLNVSFSSGCQTEETLLFDQSSDIKIKDAITTCEEGVKKASAFCFRKVVNGTIEVMECAGLFKLNTTHWFACEAFEEIFSGPSIAFSAPCHAAANLDQVYNRWPNAMRIVMRPSLVDMVGAASVVGLENRTVSQYMERDVTKVHDMWFLCLAVKLFLLVGLGLFSIRLRMKGARRVLNDDRALLDLLRQKLDDWIGVDASKDEQQTIYLHLQSSGDGDKKVWASTMPNYNAGNLGVEAET